MPEPLVTLNYSFPRMLAGEASRTTWNTALDQIDARLALFNTSLATVEADVPAYADQLLDRTAGGGATIQQYMDLRRPWSGQVPDIAARDALTGLVDGEWVEVLDDGTGHSALHYWRSAGSVWADFGAAGAPTTDASLLTSGTLSDARLSANVAFTFADNVFLGEQAIQRGLSTYRAFYIKVAGDASERFQMQADGLMGWANGLVSPDVTFGRSGIGEMTLGGKLIVTGDVAAATPAGLGTGAAGGLLVPLDVNGRLPAAVVPIQAPTTVTSLATTHTMAAGEILLLDLSALPLAHVVLPATPADGATVYIKDIGSNFDLYSVTVDPSGGDAIEADTSMFLNKARMSTKLLYSTASAGWWLI